MEREAVDDWVAAYEALWRSPGTELLAEVFSPDAVYLASPWQTPLHGLQAIADFWEAERDGPDEQFTMSHKILAVDGSTAVVRVEVDYADGDRWRDLWVLSFDAEGRCSGFEEWPFAPRQSDGHGTT
jgi:ketosteroid isomerase-like protein